MKVAGVTVLFNPDEKVVDNIKTYLPYLDNLYLVDNSKDNNKDKFSFDKKIKYIPNCKNLGIAEALNIGARESIKLKAEWLLTMDQDSAFTDKALKKIIDYAKKSKKDSKIGIISPFHKTVQNKDVVKTGIEEPLVVMTSGNLVNIEAYKEVEGFKSWMFIDAVDFEFGLNLRKHGYNIIQLNDAVLNHNLGNTVKRKFLGKVMYVSNHSAFRRYFIVRNRYYLYDMYHKDFPLFCKAEKGMTKHELLRIVLFEKNKFKKIKEMRRGYKDYKKGIKGGFHGEK